MSDSRHHPYFAAHCELQDASRSPVEIDLTDVPAAASIEIAKILTVFDGQIDDDWRALLVSLGGALIRLDAEKPHG